MHWGAENQVDLHNNQMTQAKLYEEAGADLIVGAHPHILQKIDYINDTPIAFSLGNYWFNSKTLDTGLLEVQISTAGVEIVKLIPCVQSTGVVKLLAGIE